MLHRQARRSGLVMGCDIHMIARSRACSTSTWLPPRPSPTRQARTLPKALTDQGGCCLIIAGPPPKFHGGRDNLRSRSTTRLTSPGRVWPRPWSRTCSAAGGWPRSPQRRRPPPKSSGIHRRAGARGLLERVAARQDGLVDPSVDDPSRPVLLALSDIHLEWS